MLERIQIGDRIHEVGEGEGDAMKRLLFTLFSFIGFLAACATTPRTATSGQNITGG